MKKEPQKSNTKNLIIKKSLELFANKGFDGTSMRNIANAVGITLPTIYYYFNNKEGLYKAVFQNILKKFIKEITKAEVGIKGFKEKLISRAMARYKFTAKNREMMLLYLRELYNPNGIINLTEVISKGVEMFEILIREGIKNNYLREVDPTLAGWYLMGVFNIFDIKTVSSGTLVSKEEIEFIVEIALNGIIKKK